MMIKNRLCADRSCQLKKKDNLDSKINHYTHEK